MAARSPHGAWFLLLGLACFLLLVVSMTGWFVTWWLAWIGTLEAVPGADEDLFVGVILGAWLALLSLMSVILILIGLDEMRLTYPEVGRRIARRVGPILLTPIWAVVLFVTVGLLSFVAEVQAQYARAAFTLGWFALLALGTFLMIVPAEALRPLVSRSEERAIFSAEVAALFGGLLLAGSRFVAFLLGHEPAPFLPWASVPAGLCGSFALVVLVRAAWRVASHWEPSPDAVGVVSS